MEPTASDLPWRTGLNATAAAELSAGVAELTRSGMPLPAGLRALAEELPNRRSRETLREMAARIERGEPFDAVLAGASSRLPLPLHGLMVAGLRSGRLPELMDEYARLEQERRQLRHRLQIKLAYLTLLCCAVAAFAFFIQTIFLKEVGQMIEQTRGGGVLNIFSILAWKMFGQVAWLSAGLTGFLLLMPLVLCEFRWLAWLTPATDNIPLLGPLLRNMRMASFSRTAALLLENETPLPQAICMAGASVGDVFLARDCRAVAAQIELGVPPAEALAEYWRFSRNFIPLLEWGQTAGALPESFRVAGQLHEGRAKNQNLFISAVLAPMVFLFIAGFICIAGSVIAMPSVASIDSLMGMWSWRRTPSPQWSILIPPGFEWSSMFQPLLLGFAILAAKRLVTLRRDPQNENVIEMMLNIAGWVFVVVGLVGNLLLMMGVFGFAWLVAWGIVSGFVQIRHRRAMQQALLGTMAVSAERLIPLVPAIEAFAEDARGFFAARVRRLAVLLRSGVNLPDALRQVKKVIPPHLLQIIRTGSESGAMAEGLAAAAAADDRQQAQWGSFAAKMLYIAAMPCVGFAFLSYFVLVSQAHRNILKDMEVSPPPVTLCLMNITGYLSYCWPLLVAIVGVFALLFFYAAMRYAGVPLFDLPGTDRILRRRHTAEILDNLALAVEHGRTLDGVIRSLAECYSKKTIRRRLSAVLFDLSHGAAWCESLYRRELIRGSDLAVLQSAERTGNVAWALRELADSNRRRLAQGLNVLVQLLFPPVVLCFGAMVLFVVVAMFLPLIHIIQEMSQRA